MSHETLKLNRHEQFDPNESDILVSFKYRPGAMATRIDPAEPDEIEILKIEAVPLKIGTNAALPGADITDLISEAEFEYIETFIYESWQSSKADDLADYRYEQWKDRDIDGI